MFKNKEWLLAGGSILLLILIGTSGKSAEIKQEELRLAGEDKAGLELPINWSDKGYKLVEAGVIDKDKLIKLYADRGKDTTEMEVLLAKTGLEKIVMTEQNAGLILNLLWALGLSNNNPILTSGPMTSAEYGGDPSRFASTGGWTLSRGAVMDHYSKYKFIVLNDKQQALVEKVAKNIYRPCCGNSTYFPDCNHGMAMLALLELMADQGASEQEMYQMALAVNRLWFLEAYSLIERYVASQEKTIEAKTILGSDYSSARGIQEIASKVESVGGGGGSSCGV